MEKATPLLQVSVFVERIDRPKERLIGIVHIAEQQTDTMMSSAIIAEGIRNK